MRKREVKKASKKASEKTSDSFRSFFRFVPLFSLTLLDRSVGLPVPFVHSFVLSFVSFVPISFRCLFIVVSENKNERNPTKQMSEMERNQANGEME